MPNTQTSNNLAAFIGSVADLLRGDFKQPQYKCDAQDGEMGIVGYETFSRHFYVYQPPRALEAIDADLGAVSTSIMGLLQEIHS